MRLEGADRYVQGICYRFQRPGAGRVHAHASQEAHISFHTILEHVNGQVSASIQGANVCAGDIWQKFCRVGPHQG